MSMPCALSIACRSPSTPPALWRPRFISPPASAAWSAAASPWIATKKDAFRLSTARNLPAARRPRHQSQEGLSSLPRRGSDAAEETPEEGAGHAPGTAFTADEVQRAVVDGLRHGPLQGRPAIPDLHPRGRLQ